MSETTDIPLAAVPETASVTRNNNDIRPSRTELGRKLREIRQRIVEQGTPLLDADALDHELAERRGEPS